MSIQGAIMEANAAFRARRGRKRWVCVVCGKPAPPDWPLCNPNCNEPNGGAR